MKKICLALIIITATIASLPTTALSFDFPPPAGHVTDIAKIIPQEKIDALEQRLRDYNRQTTIEIAVVTTPSLDGMPIEQWTIELVEKPAWKVGKKGKDNGVVIVVAPNERKYRIEVGYGLQGDLTDARAGRLGQQNLVESFRARDYAGGIDKLITAIMGTLGTYTEEERAKIKEQKAQAAIKEAQMQREQAEEIKVIVVTVFISLLALAALAGIAYGLMLLLRKISRAKKEAKRKNNLRASISERAAMCQKKAKLLTQKMKETSPSEDNYPAWALEKIRNSIAITGRTIETATNKWQSSLKTAKDDPDNAEPMMTSAEDHIKKAETEINKATLVPKEIETYKNEVSKAIAEAETNLRQANANTEKAKAAGFRINGISEELKKEEKTLSSLKNTWSKCSDKDRYIKGLDFLNTARAAKESILSTANELHAMLETKKSADKQLAAFPASLAEIKESLPTCHKTLSEIKKEYPAENWRDIESEVIPIPDALATAEELYQSATKNNSMENQNFAKAATNIAKATDILNSSKTALANINKRQAELKTARTYFTGNLDKVASDIAKAARKVNDTDVGTKARNIVREADKKLSDVKSQAADTTAINWLLAAATLQAIAILAASAIKLAESDIADAKQAKALAKRRAEEASISAYSTSHSSSSYDSDSSSSSGGFGGFGGGGFGGGGASGGW